MMNGFCLPRRFSRIIVMTFIIAIAIQSVTAEAWESQKIAIAPVIDRAGYKSTELNQQLEAKLKSV